MAAAMAGSLRGLLLAISAFVSAWQFELMERPMLDASESSTAADAACFNRQASRASYVCLTDRTVQGSEYWEFAEHPASDSKATKIKLRIDEIDSRETSKMAEESGSRTH